jgi:hypothetical protein
MEFRVSPLSQTLDARIGGAGIIIEPIWRVLAKLPHGSSRAGKQDLEDISPLSD